MQFIKNISKRLKMVRIASGYNTAKEFTEKYSIPASTYSQHENGKRGLSIENIIHYAEVIKVDPSWLITGEGNPCGSYSDKTLEKIILEEQDRLELIGELEATAIPLIEIENRYSNVNIQIFKNILEELLPLLKNIPDSKTEDAINFCFELYNIIVATNVNGNERLKIVRICLESFFKGLGVNVTDELLKNVAMA